MRHIQGVRLYVEELELWMELVAEYPLSEAQCSELKLVLQHDDGLTHYACVISQQGEGRYRLDSEQELDRKIDYSDPEHLPISHVTFVFRGMHQTVPNTSSHFHDIVDLFARHLS
ncbi:hypothetical protein GF380_01560 [Candidatus Uhrbacteria bacterium]|nr:hypothetical protein [Candidatus Uhrbacteria bacterium]MBD3283954.1 hypothetical protein [Candidatus Uhrbacteria bacterium]